MRTPIEDSGFTPPAGHPLGTERRTVALAELVAIAALAISTIVVATVVSAGIARAMTAWSAMKAACSASPCCSA